jgi:hypothetical protein
MIKNRFQIGVFGTAFNEKLLTESMLEKAYVVGSEIAKSKYVLITGATTGVPNEAAKGTNDHGGLAIGISPASTPWQHKTEFKKPLENNDAVIYTGMGFTGRNVINIKSCDACIFIGGELGTLNEFTIAYYESKIIGILENSGYIADTIKDILKVVKTDHGAIVVFDSDPVALVSTISKEIENKYAKT